MKYKLIQDGTLLFLGTCINMILMMLTQVILARNLNLEEYGAVISAFNLVNFFALFISLGASEYILKSFGRYGDSAYKIVQLWIKILPVNLILLIIILLWIFENRIFGDLTSIFLLIILPNILLQGLLPLTLSIYQIEGNYKKITIINIVLYCTRFLASIVALVGDVGINWIGYALSIISICSLLYYYLHLRRYFLKDLKIPIGEFEILKEPGVLGLSIKGIIPYALLAFFYYGFYQSSLIFINLYLNEGLVGIYNVAFTIIALTFILPTIILSQLFNPKLHFWITNDIQKVINLFMNGSKWMLLVGLIVAGIVFFLNDFLINLLFGSKFSEASRILMLLLIIIPIRYIQAVSDAIMNIENQIKIKVWIFFTVFVVNLVLNIVFIPNMGLNGVILSTIISEILLFILTFIFCWKFIGAKIRFLHEEAK